MKMEPSRPLQPCIQNPRFRMFTLPSATHVLQNLSHAASKEHCSLAAAQALLTSYWPGADTCTGSTMERTRRAEASHSTLVLGCIQPMYNSPYALYYLRTATILELQRNVYRLWLCVESTRCFHSCFVPSRCQTSRNPMRRKPHCSRVAISQT